MRLKGRKMAVEVGLGALCFVLGAWCFVLGALCFVRGQLSVANGCPSAATVLCTKVRDIHLTPKAFANFSPGLELATTLGSSNKNDYQR
jgi:hypothetical protein